MKRTVLAGVICLTLSTALLLSSCSSDDEATPQSPATQPGEEWGEPVEGVQLQLRADKKVWKVDQVPTFQVNIHNGSIRPLYNSRPGNNTIHELEFDGHWYRDLAKVSSAMRVVQPGKEWAGIVVRLGRSWDLLPKLTLKPGRHTVRVAFNGTLYDPRDADYTKPVRAVSKPVEIEIQPATQE